MLVTLSVFSTGTGLLVLDNNLTQLLDCSCTCPIVYSGNFPYWFYGFVDSVLMLVPGVVGCWYQLNSCPELSL
jgi:hypothetical protein